MIAPSEKPALVASIHSVEQIPTLKREVFTDLIARLPNLTGVHIEPVSFQLPLERRGPRAPLSSAAYAAQHDYNRNLWSILTGLESEGIIEIEDVAADIIGLNAKNPSTYIRWQARRGPRARTRPGMNGARLS
jgi:hypothetical protein